MSLKVVIVGAPNVGKTSIVLRLAGRIPSLHSESTIGCSFMHLLIEGQSINIWDTAGQERYMSILPMYYRDANIILFTFDVTDLSSIDRMGDFIHSYYSTRKEPQFEPTIIFIGNKIDSIYPSETQIQDYLFRNESVIRYNLIETDLIFVSARSNININLLSSRLGKEKIKKSEPKVDLIMMPPPPPKTFCDNNQCFS